MNMLGKIGPPRNTGKGDGVGQRLARDEQHQSPPPCSWRRVWIRGVSASWPEKSTCELPLPVASPKAIARPATARPAMGVSSSRRRPTIGARYCELRRMSVPSSAAANTDAERPEELGEVGRTELGDVRHGEPEGTEPRPAVETDEDERTDSGGDQAGREDDTEHGSGQAGDLHQQERPGDRRAEEGADGGEAAGRADDHARHGRRVPLHQMQDEHTETASERDQRRLRAEHRAESPRSPGRRRRCRGADAASTAPSDLNPSDGSCPPVPGR